MQKGGRSRLAWTGLSLALLGAGHAHAERSGFALDHYSPAERGSDWFVLESLDLRGHLRPDLGLTLDYAHHPLVTTDSSGNIVDALVSEQMFAHVGGSLVLFDRLRVGLNLPIGIYAKGDAAVVDGQSYAPPAHAFALGDLRLGADMRLFGQYGELATGAVGVQVFLPTGDEASFSGDGSARLAPRALLAGESGPIVYAGRLGMLLSRSQAFGGGQLGNRFDFAGSVGLRLAHKALVIGPEIWGDTVLSNGAAFSQRGTPLEGLLGAHYSVTDSIKLGAAVSGGLTAGFGTPLVRGLASFDWSPAPSAEPLPPSDRDHDGILDRDDACVDVPGLKTHDPKTNGCPAPDDRDHDGVVDTQDACPDVAGIETDDPKTNGCPSDRDHDTILDTDDACPDVPGLHTEDPKTNGCPDPDRDHDGVLNEPDACPDDPGPTDPDPKRNGCPKAFVKGDQIQILDQVKFKTGSAEILPGKDSEEVLQAVLAVLQKHPEIKQLRVEGHTDSRGSAKLNRTLSAKRAASVVAWLVKHGLDASSLASAGWGPDRPIDSNDTEAGRKNNRRVEFHIDSAPAGN